MSTERHDKVRVSLYGCSHKPRVSAMCAPKTGDQFFCPTCHRKRRVLGMVTTWAKALVECQDCKFRIQNAGQYGKKRLVALSLRHASARMHRVHITHDGQLDIVKGQSNNQIPLIDDLLL